MKRYLAVAVFFVLNIFYSAFLAQPDQIYERPKIVVGIVVDQMRYDYLTRFWHRFSDEGFKRLVLKGHSFKNAHYNYVPTYTAPGHTSIYTGTTPRYHGIIGNSWYHKGEGKFIDCVTDDEVKPVGTKSDKGKKSPKNLLASTVCDQNRIASQFRGRTIGIALKDRGAILPAGRSANAAYWFVGGDEGKFVTSSYYHEKLPEWADKFNNSKEKENFLKDWETILPISSYKASVEDYQSYEEIMKKREETPADEFKKLGGEKDKKKGKYDAFFSTPFGNTLTTEFALAAIDGEKLGQSGEVDFLTISYSSTDYIGHKHGVSSVEIEDCYLRLDKDLAVLLNGLDTRFGHDAYLVFLTADHGANEVPVYLQTKDMSAGYFNAKEVRKDIYNFVHEKFEIDSLISHISNYQVFLNHHKIIENNLDRRIIENALSDYLMSYPHIARVYTRAMIESGNSGAIAEMVRKGFNPKRSGDIVYVFEPEYIADYNKLGSTHGSPYKYDTHVPILFYGRGIKPGQTYDYVEITDIAPTVSALLGIAFPNSSIGKVRSEIFKEK